MEIRITKDGAWKEYPYRAGLYLDGEKVWEDDFGEDAPLDTIWRTFENIIEEQGLKK